MPADAFLASIGSRSRGHAGEVSFRNRCSMSIGEVQPVDTAFVIERRHRRPFRRDFHPAEHPEHLSDIAGETLEGEHVGCGPVPLHDVVMRRIPEERKADRGVRGTIVLGLVEVGGGRAIENHAERVQPGRTPGYVGATMIDKVPEPVSKFRKAPAKLVFVDRRDAGRLDQISGLQPGSYLPAELAQIGADALLIRDGGCKSCSRAENRLNFSSSPTVRSSAFATS